MNLWLILCILALAFFIELSLGKYLMGQLPWWETVFCLGAYLVVSTLYYWHYMRTWPRLDKAAVIMLIIAACVFPLGTVGFLLGVTIVLCCQIWVVAVRDVVY